MNNTKHTLNELLVKIFNYILYIEEKILKQNGIKLSMNEVHILEMIQKSEDTSMSFLAKKLMVTQGTFTTNANRLIRKGYVRKYPDDKDKRITRLELEDVANSILKIHEEFHENMIDKVIRDLDLENDDLLNKTFIKIVDYFEEEYNNLTKIAKK